MQKFLLLPLLCLAFAAQAQTSAGIADISSIKTDRHVNIAGTRLFVVPPPGFQPAATGTGLQKGEQGYLQVFDLAGGNFYTNAAEFSAEAFEKEGVKVLTFANLQVNGFPAKYIEVLDARNTHFYDLVLGDSTFSVMMIGMAADDHTATGNDIKAALQTIFYDKNFRIDPLASVPFTLDDSQSKFKFAKSAAGFLLYSIGGIDKPSYNNEPFVLVSILPMDNGLSASDLTDYMIIKLEKYGLSDKEPYTTSDAPIDGKTARETVFYGNMNNKRSLVYMQIVVDNQRAVVFQCVFDTDIDTHLQEARTLARTLKFKT